MHSSLMDNAAFLADFARLVAVSLNPERHTSANGYEHSLRVARRAWALALANGLGEERAARLHDLGLVHDIGKTLGTTAPAKSVEMLPRYGITEARFMDMVRYHDVNLSWHIAAGRGEPPTDKAWRKMASRVDMLELALFMVADREDCPGGFRENAPLMWFLAEAERRGLVAASGLVLDVGGNERVECSAGALVVRESPESPESPLWAATQVLVVDLGRGALELPKGHLEAGERPEEAALRELDEESGVGVPSATGVPLALHAHAFQRGETTVVKYVYYTRIKCRLPTERPPPPSLRERRWVTASELETLPLVGESLRALLVGALS